MSGGMGSLAEGGGTHVGSPDAPTDVRKGRSALFKVTGMMVPNQEALLASVFPARIVEIRAAEGSIIPKAELVVVLDDTVQKARTRIARAASESTLDLALARTDWEKAKHDLHRLVNLSGHDSASSKELADAKVEAQVRSIEYELALFDHDQARRVYQREQAILDQHHVRAPFTGYIAQHLKTPGETVDQLEGVVRLVQLDPLLVCLDCPVALAHLIGAGDQVLVRPVDPNWGPRRGIVSLASRVVDGASQTFKVKITVNNGDGAWMAGLKVEVEFHQKKGSRAGTWTGGVDKDPTGIDSRPIFP